MNTTHNVRELFESRVKESLSFFVCLFIFLFWFPFCFVCFLFLRIDKKRSNILRQGVNYDVCKEN